MSRTVAAGTSPTAVTTWPPICVEKALAEPTLRGLGRRGPGRRAGSMNTDTDANAVGEDQVLHRDRASRARPAAGSRPAGSPGGILRGRQPSAAHACDRGTPAGARIHWNPVASTAGSSSRGVDPVAHVELREVDRLDRRGPSPSTTSERSGIAVFSSSQRR